MTPQAQRMPLTLADPHKGVPPTAYVFRMRRQHCQRCGYYFESLDLLAETWLRAHDTAKPFKNYRPLDERNTPHYNVPVRTEKTDIERLPFCSECITPDLLNHLPSPPWQPPRIVGSSPDRGGAPPKVAPSPKATPSAKPKREPKPSSPSSLASLAKDLDL
jgi:hypothetical protein